jgi:hypothetical protein
VITGTKLVAPRTGSQIVNRLDGKAVNDQLVIIAAWETKEHKAPKRCVVRIDGIIRDQLDESKAPGFPCAMVSVQYSIGGLARKLLVDCVGQSALVLWAESIEVLAAWDERRVTRLAEYSVKPCREQQVAAAINSDETVGDTGPSDARWIDVLALDELGEFSEEWSIHPIPNGARGVRFLNALAGGANVRTANLSTQILFSSSQWANRPTGVVETAINGFTDQSVIIVPAGAIYMFVQFPAGTFATFDTAPWVEWIMAPNTLFGG